ncbi:hypothetical protein [Knoellia sinensis]|uniref:hypothetical protein n=1 Tax=Knoellia sinensis TaxID=136100 RepID=UPI000B2534BA|nr:hypothetical protein [Knoellia sinensis]
MSRRVIRPVLGVIALAASTFAVSAPATVSAASAPSPAVAECDPATGATSAARVRDDAKNVKEPALYNKSEANAYGVLPDAPLLAAGSVTVPTIFHVVSKDTLDAAGKTRLETMIADQVDVLNDAFSGTTAPDASDTPFRFDHTKTTWTANPVWNTVTPGKVERDMKKALHEGDSTTLNVYVADTATACSAGPTSPRASTTTAATTSTASSCSTSRCRAAPRASTRSATP